MKYYINPFLFYLIDVVSSLNIIVVIAALILLIVILFCAFDNFAYDEITYPWNKLKKLIVYFIITVIIAVFIPEESTMKEMLIASYITEDNITTATNYGKDLVDYIFEKVEATNKQEKEEDKE